MSGLAELWHKHNHLNVERVRTLETVAKAALHSRLDRQWRTEGEQAAHNLAGSLGTFGFGEASTAAFEIEAMLRTGILDFRRFAEGLLTIREAVDSELVEPDIEGDLLLADNPDVPGGPPQRQPAETVRVVFCGTDQELVERLCSLATPHGCTVETVADASAAIAAITSAPAAALVIDLPTGDLDDMIVGHDSGTGTTGESAVARAADLVPVFVLTGDDDLSYRLAAVRAGAVGFLRRDCQAEEIAAFVASVAAPPVKVTLRVLVVDDDPGVLRHIAEELPEPSCDVTAVSEPLDCWPALEQQRPDVVLIDLNMPGVCGLDLCHMLRSDPRWHRLPVIVMVDVLDVATAEGAFAAGADDLIAKPVIGSVLRARIAAHAERCR